MVADSLVTQALIDAREGKLNRDTHVVAYARRRGARPAAKSVDGDLHYN